MGTVTGIVGMMGGLGGFFLPIMFGAILDWLGINSSCFMLLYGIVWVSLTLNYLTEVRRAPVMGENVMGENIRGREAAKPNTSQS
jgi:NNP family nitrate/nitrite transporter-like MFS transporter